VRKPEANYYTYTNTYKVRNNTIDLRHYTSIYLVDDGSLEIDSSIPSKEIKGQYLKGTIIVVLKLLYSVIKAGTY
jgi:hypothetical protein